MLFGGSPSQICVLFREVLDFVYALTGPVGQPTWLHRNRNLSIPANLINLYEEVHHYTMLQERTASLLAPKVPAGWKLCVFIWDSRATLVDHNLNHWLQRRTWSTKHHGNSLSRLEACDSAGMPVFALSPRPSTSPANTDEGIMGFQLHLEEQGGVVGGLITVMSGLPGYYLVHVFDKGFRQYGLAGRESMEDILTRLQLAQGAQPCFDWIMPTGNQQDFLDRNLMPAGQTNLVLGGGRMVDRVANTSRVCTAIRMPIEQLFSRYSHFYLSGVKYPLPAAYLQRCGRGPTPDLPIIHEILSVIALIIRETYKPFLLTYELPLNVTYAMHGADIRDRIEQENMLCFTKQHVWNRQDIWKKPTQAELNRGNFGLRRANLMDPTTTDLPLLTYAQVMEITGGPHTVDEARSYLTSIEENLVLAEQGAGGLYIDPATYHQAAAGLPREIEAYIFRQVHPPVGYDMARYGPWEPVNIILVVGIPGRHSSQVKRNVVMAYVPISDGAVLYNRMNYREPVLARFKAICCDKSSVIYCLAISYYILIVYVLSLLTPVQLVLAQLGPVCMGQWPSWQAASTPSQAQDLSSCPPTNLLICQTLALHRPLLTH